MVSYSFSLSPTLVLCVSGNSDDIRRWQVGWRFRKTADNCKRLLISSQEWSVQSEPYITLIKWQQLVVLTPLIQSLKKQLHLSADEGFKLSDYNLLLLLFPLSGALSRQKATPHLPLSAPPGVHQVRWEQVQMYWRLQKHGLLKHADEEEPNRNEISEWRSETYFIFTDCVLHLCSLCTILHSFDSINPHIKDRKDQSLSRHQTLFTS